MEEVYIKGSELTDLMIEDLPKKDLFSVSEIMDAYEDALFNLKCLQEEYEDLKKDMEDNYKPRYSNPYDEYGVSERDFH